MAGKIFTVARRDFQQIDYLQYWTARLMWHDLPKFGKKRDSQQYRLAAEKLIGYGV